MRDPRVVCRARVEMEKPEFDHICSVVEAATAHGKLTLLARLRSYWDDADYQATEIVQLRTELVELRQVPALPSGVVELLGKLSRLCDLAIHERKSIEVRAD